MRIYIVADHAGYRDKEYLKKYLAKKKIEAVDLGNAKFTKGDDYPDFAKKLAKKIKGKDLGVSICGSGQGMCMTVNKFKNVRGAFGWSVADAKRSKHDNDSNVLCLSAWRHTQEQNARILNAWLNTRFSNLARHKRRVKKIHA